MRFVAVMAGREMRASWRRLLFFFLCIALGVGAIVTLRSVIQSVRQVFAGEARALLGADLVVSSSRPIDGEVAATVDARLSAAGAAVTRTAETATMARAAAGGGQARMVELKAVGPGFPYYGTLQLEREAQYTHAMVAGGGALVRPELLAQLGLAVGDRLAIGGKEFVVRGVIQAEPGRRLGAFSLGPRVIVDLTDLEQTSLLDFGSRVTYQRLAKVPDAALPGLVTALRGDVKNRFIRVRSYTATEGDLGEDFARAENYLSLVGLIVVILGGVGVSSVTRVFVQQKIKSIAILKCLGARGGQVLAIYMAQVTALGVLGSVVGVAMAVAVMAWIPAFLGPAVTAGINVTYRLTPSAVAQGAGTGLLVSMLFALVPLLDVRHVKPSQLLRDEEVAGRRDPARWLAMAAVGGALIGVTMWQAGSMRIGGIVAAGFAALAVVLYLAGRALIAAVRPLAASPWFPLRHAALQLTRPGGQVHLVLLTVGLGTFFILGVRALQENLVQEVAVDMAADAPDMFLLDIQRDQLDGVLAALTASMPAGSPAPRALPVLRARVTGVQGREVTLDDYEDVRGRGSLAREYTVTYRSALENNERIVAGARWDTTPAPEGEVSIEESIRDRFGIDVGDTMRFDVLGRVVSATVTTVRHVEWSDSRAGGFMFVFRPGLLDAAPHGHIAFVRGPASTADRAGLLGRLAREYPNVSVIDGREMLAAITTVVDNVTLAVTVVGSLVVVSGLLILIGAVAMTKFRRVYEAAILKTLGATRRVIATMLLLEYGVLGALAGVLGAVGAAGLTWALSRFAFDMAYRSPTLLLVVGVAVCGLTVSAVGVASSWDVLQRRPLSTLSGR
ncbi:MAG: FtsX-like permease family protein [Acidobacteria bacterium]|nr:FtsX-like permease family protein [Acidobacteriota bacterium]